MKTCKSNTNFFGKNEKRDVKNNTIRNWILKIKATQNCFLIKFNIIQIEWKRAFINLVENLIWISFEKFSKFINTPQRRGFSEKIYFYKAGKLRNIGYPKSLNPRPKIIHAIEEISSYSPLLYCVYWKKYEKSSLI
jgi:hypothetical protein